MKNAKGARGCAMAFGPGLTAETMLFRLVSPFRRSHAVAAREEACDA
jgi:hypothetical protein